MGQSCEAAIEGLVPLILLAEEVAPDWQMAANVGESVMIHGEHLFRVIYLL